MLRVQPPCLPAKPAHPALPTASPRGRFSARPLEEELIIPTPTWPSSPPVAVPTDSLPDLRAALSSLDSQLATLVRERAALSRSLEAAARASSPIARLPPELLAAVFAAAVAGADDAPLHLLRVCRHWAALAQDTPALWTRIQVGPHHPLERARVRLARAKALPLDVALAFDRRHAPAAETAQALSAALAVLAPHIGRWRSFALAVPSRAHAQLALALCTAPAPRLELLHIRVADTYTAEDSSLSTTPQATLFGGHTPRLVECALHGWTPGRLRGLRVLELAGYWDGAAPPLRDLLAALRACPALESLALRNMSDLEPDEPGALAPPPAAPSIYLPRLRRLALSYAGGARARAVLAQLALPALEDVELCYLDGIGPLLLHLTAQAAAGLPLARLRLENCTFREDALGELLRRVPRLAVLELVDVHDVGAGILQNLASPGPQGWVCPALDTLCLEGCSSFDFASLRTFVSARIAPDVRAFPAPATRAPPAPVAHPYAAPGTSDDTALARAARRPSVATNGRSHSAPPDGAPGWAWPVRLRRLALGRCEQLSAEMLGWLRVYVPDVAPAPASSAAH